MAVRAAVLPADAGRIALSPEPQDAVACAGGMPKHATTATVEQGFADYADYTPTFNTGGALAKYACLPSTTLTFDTPVRGRFPPDADA